MCEGRDYGDYITSSHSIYLPIYLSIYLFMSPFSSFEHLDPITNYNKPQQTTPNPNQYNLAF